MEHTEKVVWCLHTRTHTHTHTTPTRITPMYFSLLLTVLCFNILIQLSMWKMRLMNTWWAVGLSLSSGKSGHAPALGPQVPVPLPHPSLGYLLLNAASFAACSLTAGQSGLSHNVTYLPSWPCGFNCPHRRFPKAKAELPERLSLNKGDYYLYQRGTCVAGMRMCP